MENKHLENLPPETEMQKKTRGGVREGAGRPAFEPTEHERIQVAAMAGYGLPHTHIAALIRNGIDDDTLRKWFSSELEQGKAKANLKIGQTLFQKAVNGDTTAAIWWSKTQMGWRESVRLDHTSSDRSMSPQSASDAVLEAVALGKTPDAE
jgi:hypothetical protein